MRFFTDDITDFLERIGHLHLSHVDRQRGLSHCSVQKFMTIIGDKVKCRNVTQHGIFPGEQRMGPKSPWSNKQKNVI